MSTCNSLHNGVKVWGHRDETGSDGPVTLELLLWDDTEPFLWNDTDYILWE